MGKLVGGELSASDQPCARANLNLSVDASRKRNLVVVGYTRSYPSSATWCYVLFCLMRKGTRYSAYVEDVESSDVTV